MKIKNLVRKISEKYSREKKIIDRVGSRDGFYTMKARIDLGQKSRSETGG